MIANMKFRVKNTDKNVGNAEHGKENGELTYTTSPSGKMLVIVPIVECYLILSTVAQFKRALCFSK